MLDQAHSPLPLAVAEAVAAGHPMLAEPEAKAALRFHGIAVPEGHAGRDAAETLAVLNPPADARLVLKAVAPTLIHKSDAGGVRVGLAPDEVLAAAAAMESSVSAHGHVIDRFLVERMSAPGHEVVVGAVRSDDVGWAVMVGLGGVFVEVFADVAFGVAPLTRADIAGMLGELRALPLLQGARGTVAANLDSLTDLIERLAGPDGLLSSLPPEVTEIDLNPVIVTAEGATAVDARFVLTPRADAVHRRAAASGVPDLRALYSPRTIAVLGASGNRPNAANAFIRGLAAAEFRGTVAPVHRTADEIEGIPTVRSLADVDGTVDYVYVALPGGAVTEALTAPAGKVRFAQVISSGFAEVSDGAEREHELVERMRAQGTRLLGPNCLGTHSSVGRFSFIPNAPLEPGRVGIVSQSGGLSVDVLRLGAARGVRFHSVTSIGNGADLRPAEIVAAMLEDDDIGVIGLYLESLGYASEILAVVRRSAARKPIVLLAGGRTANGSRAASSHTGALTGNHRLWPAVARQCGMSLTDSLDEFLDTLAAFQAVADRPAPSGDGAILFGNGGGANVLAADVLARLDIVLPELSAEVQDRIDAIGLPPGNGLTNPLDTPAPTLTVDEGGVAGAILEIAIPAATPAMVISHFNVGIVHRNLSATYGDVMGRVIDSIAATAAAHPECLHYLVLKGDGEADIDQLIREYTDRSVALGLPVFGSVEAAATAGRAVLDHLRTAQPVPAAALNPA